MFTPFDRHRPNTTRHGNRMVTKAEERKLSMKSTCHVRPRPWDGVPEAVFRANIMGRRWIDCPMCSGAHRHSTVRFVFNGQRWARVYSYFIRRTYWRRKKHERPPT